MSDTTGDEIAEIQLFRCLLCQLVYGNLVNDSVKSNTSKRDTDFLG